MIDGTRYLIQIEPLFDDADDVYKYVGTCPDNFPDVMYHGRHPGEAYWGVVDAIEGLLAMQKSTVGEDQG